MRIALSFLLFALTACNQGRIDTVTQYQSKTGTASDFEYRNFDLKSDGTAEIFTVVYTGGAPTYFSFSSGTYKLEQFHFQFSTTITHSNNAGDCGAIFAESNRIVDRELGDVMMPSYTMIREGFTSLSAPTISPLTNACP